MKDPLAFKIYFLLQTGILKKTQKKFFLIQPHTSNAKLRVINEKCKRYLNHVSPDNINHYYTAYQALQLFCPVKKR